MKNDSELSTINQITPIYKPHNIMQDFDITPEIKVSSVHHSVQGCRDDCGSYKYIYNIIPLIIVSYTSISICRMTFYLYSWPSY